MKLLAIIRYEMHGGDDTACIAMIRINFQLILMKS